MGKNGGKNLQAFCVNRIRPIVRVPLQNKLNSSPIYVKKNYSKDENEKQNIDKFEDGIEKPIEDIREENHGKRKRENIKSLITPKVYEQLYSMKRNCQSKRPEVKIIEGKEKGPTIVEEARKQEISLLVLGQKKRSTTWQLLLMWAGNKSGLNGGGLVEYCIQNATCMALAVRRKSKNVGGYLITAKRQKDFWLLA
ncbi:hypothetical protein RND81_11G050200 [Saponaria officinalis]|uniref:UspA domain-containing protein n=1 Tax=Saponaria officinalis TaxID=3572 RepID=A0AAW1HHZ6_SAPOF